MSGTAMERATKGWGDDMPDWVQVLAEKCDASSQAAAAKRMRCSAGVVSQVLSNSYPASLAGIEERTRAAFMSADVECPVLGTLDRARCLHEQRQKYSSANRTRVQLYRACRSGCPHSNHNAKGDGQ
ncbi:MAG: hypothetical protein RIB84_22400 [Sneathiellaceae bacterium]